MTKDSKAKISEPELPETEKVKPAPAKSKERAALTEKETAGRSQALNVALEQIEKAFGKGSIMKLADARALDVEVIPTGSISLDLALGVGGLPRGRIVEIYGPEASGKTTLAMSVMAEAQRHGGLVAIVDAEHAFSTEYAKNIGLNIDELLVSQPDSGEQALEITETLVRSNALDVIVVDSVAALVPQKEIDGEMGDAQVGAQARLMSQALRKLTGAVSKSKTVLIFINQLRMKIGVMFGNPETTTGGMALKFYSSVRIDVRRIETLKSGDKVIGNRVRAKIVKNKVAPPFSVAEFEILFPDGISREGDVLDLAVLHGLVEKSGTWFSKGEIKIGQGRDAARLYLKEHPDLFEDLKKQITEAVNSK